MQERIPKESWNIIQCIIRRYYTSKEEYENRREELLESTPKSDGQPRGNLTSSGIENAVIALNSPYMDRIRREVKAVEKAYSGLSEEYRKVIRLRYWQEVDRNTPYLNMERLTGYSERQMRRICRDFIYAVGREIGEI